LTLMIDGGARRCCAGHGSDTKGHTMPRPDPIAAELDALRAEVARLTAQLGPEADPQPDSEPQPEAQSDRLRAAGAEALAGAEGWARAHPGSALGLAAGLGFALGLMIGGRR